MNGSVFYNLLSIEEEMHNNLTVVERLFERYSKEKNAILIGDTWCQLCEQEVGFLLGLRPSGKVFKQKEKSVDFPEWIINLASKIKELDITIPEKLLHKNNLAKIIKETELTEENKDSFKKLIYFYLLNFLLFPTSGEKASLKYISYDIDEIEEIDWPKVILENVYADIGSYESTLLKCERLNAKNEESEGEVKDKKGEVKVKDKEGEVKDKERDEEEEEVAGGVVTGHEYMLSDGKHKCTFCEDKEKSLVEQVEAQARRPKLSLSYEPCIMKVHQSIGLEILKFCLDSVLSDKVEKLSFKETQEDILRPFESIKSFHIMAVRYIVSKARVAGLHDKGKAAILEIETTSCDKESGVPLCMNRTTVFLRGAGGFSKSSHPYSFSNYSSNQVPAIKIPKSQPFASFEDITQPSQALLYRLSGDYNPLHSDPMVAEIAGFSRPILHGLCTLGFAVRAVVRCICRGDPDMVKNLSGRFLLHVFPGETLNTEMWLDGLRVIYQVKVKQRNKVVLSGHVDLNRLASQL
ncbi:hypothetical protein KSS87_017258 [Heliosperma pusillum]|nr:hypothetical protein KSS87_017258 [Heliosperma pusillum]